MTAHLQSAIDAINIALVVHSAARMTIGKRLGYLIGPMTTTTVLNFVLTHTPPGTGAHAASWPSTIGILGGTTVMLSVLICRAARVKPLDLTV